MTRTALQAIVEESAPGPFMLRRLAQAAVMQDRGISARALAREADVSNQTISSYLRGNAPRQNAAKGETEKQFEKRAREFEDHVEYSLERMIREMGQFGSPPRATRVVGPADETGIPEVEWIDPYIAQATTRELMRSPR